MILRQFLHADPVAISYLFGCGGHAACAVVDPLGDIEPYLRVAKETGMRIRFVVDPMFMPTIVPPVGLSPVRQRPNTCCTPTPMSRFRFMPRRMATGYCSAMSLSMCCTRLVIRLSTSAFWWPTARGRTSPGSS